MRIAGEVGPVLGLAEQVGGDEPASAVLVGDDQDLRRPGEQVDADEAEQLALGLGDVGVAGADEHVDGLEVLDPEGHRGQRLHAAEADDLVGARGRHRVAASPGGCPRPCCGGAQATTRRDARDLRHDHGHERRGEHRIAPARHVGADGVDRDVLVARARRPAASRRAGRSASRAGPAANVADLLLGERDVLAQLVVERLGGAVDLVLRRRGTTAGSQPSSSRE